MATDGVVPARQPVDPALTVTPEDLRRATVAMAVGSMLEYYDFALYGLASALIFSQLFFPALGAATGLVAVFSVYAVGFLARPVGGLVFGSLGDRIGRKTVLLITIALMGLSSMAIGLLPTAATAGALAPILLIVLRLAQGLGAGAEQAGATVLMAEVSPAKRRGFFSALPFVGIQAGTLLATGTFIILTLLPEDVMLGWAWRIPFLFSFVLILVALWIRLHLKESPAFAKLAHEHEAPPQPVRDLVRHSKRQVGIGIGLRMGENGSSYIYSTLSIAFITGVVGVSKSIGPTAVATAALISIFTVPFAGHLSDRYGRIPVYRAAAGFQLLFAFPAFYLLNTGNPLLAVFTLAVAIGIGVQGMLGPQCAYLPELFGTQHRYTGVAVSREFSAIIAGGIAPLVGAALLAAFNNAWWPLATYVAVLCLITFLTTFIAPDRPGRDLFSTADEGLGQRRPAQVDQPGLASQSSREEGTNPRTTPIPDGPEAS